MQVFNRTDAMAAFVVNFMIFGRYLTNIINFIILLKVNGDVM